MPYFQRDEIKTPPDDTVIWRYFKFHRFLDAIKNCSLYFSPISKYDDPWEAAIPQSGLEWRHKKLIEAEKKGDSELQKEFQNILKIEAWRIKFTKAVKANCWYIGDSESEAMWKLYIGSGDGVAIKSTVNRIKSAIRDCSQQIFIGKLNYIDYGTAEFNDVQWFDLCFHKRKAFSHENEMRIAFVNALDMLHPASDPQGIEVPVNMDTLIDELFVSSTRADLREEVVKVINEHNLKKEVFLTALSLPPISGLSLFKFVKANSI